MIKYTNRASGGPCLHLICDCMDAKHGGGQGFASFWKRREGSAQVSVATLNESAVALGGEALGNYAVWLDRYGVLHLVTVTKDEATVTAKTLEKRLTEIAENPRQVLRGQKALGKKVLLQIWRYHEVLATYPAEPVGYVCKHMIAASKWIMRSATGRGMAQAFWLPKEPDESWKLPQAWLNGNVRVLGYGDEDAFEKLLDWQFGEG